MRRFYAQLLQLVCAMSVLVTVSIISRQGREMNTLTYLEEQEVHVDKSWVVAQTKEGFMEVQLVLSDPRTTGEPLGESEYFLEFETKNKDADEVIESKEYRTEQNRIQ